MQLTKIPKSLKKIITSKSTTGNIKRKSYSLFKYANVIFFTSKENNSWSVYEYHSGGQTIKEAPTEEIAVKNTIEKINTITGIKEFKKIIRKFIADYGATEQSKYPCLLPYNIISITSKNETMQTKKKTATKKKAVSKKVTAKKAATKKVKKSEEQI